MFLKKTLQQADRLQSLGHLATYMLPSKAINYVSTKPLHGQGMCNHYTTNECATNDQATNHNATKKPMDTIRIEIHVLAHTLTNTALKMSA